MVLNHIAAVVLFSGPLFWIGVWMAVDPAGVTALAEATVRVPRRVAWLFRGAPGGEIAETEHVEVCRRTRTALRLAGVVLVLFAIAL